MPLNVTDGARATRADRACLGMPSTESGLPARSPWTRAFGYWSPRERDFQKALGHLFSPLTRRGRCTDKRRHQEFIHFPQLRAASGSRRQAHPRHRRQLRHPRASQRHEMAGPSSGDGRSTSRRPPRRGSMPSKGSSRPSRGAKSDATSSNPSPISKTRSAATSRRTTKRPGPSFGPHRLPRSSKSPPKSVNHLNESVCLVNIFTASSRWGLSICIS